MRNIKDDAVANEIYGNLTKNEWKGFQQAISLIRKIFPDIDLYKSNLSSGDHISLGKKTRGAKKGTPLFVVRKKTEEKEASIKIRIDSKIVRIKLSEKLNSSWEEINSRTFTFESINVSEEKFKKFVNSLKAQTELVAKRVLGKKFFPDDYGEIFKEAGDAEDSMWEGAKITVKVNKYERDRKARLACIKHHGCNCKVCDVTFEDLYGNELSGFIHVHHIVPISKIGETYKVDPINDLIPVCPNCHSAIHFGGKTRSIDAVRKMLKKTNK